MAMKVISVLLLVLVASEAVRLTAEDLREMAELMDKRETVSLAGDAKGLQAGSGAAFDKANADLFKTGFSVVLDALKNGKNLDVFLQMGPAEKLALVRNLYDAIARNDQAKVDMYDFDLNCALFVDLSAQDASSPGGMQKAVAPSEADQVAANKKMLQMINADKALRDAGKPGNLDINAYWNLLKMVVNIEWEKVKKDPVDSKLIAGISNFRKTKRVVADLREVADMLELRGMADDFNSLKKGSGAGFDVAMRDLFLSGFKATASSLKGKIDTAAFKEMSKAEKTKLVRDLYDAAERGDWAIFAMLDSDLNMELFVQLAAYDASFPSGSAPAVKFSEDAVVQANKKLIKMVNADKALRVAGKPGNIDVDAYFELLKMIVNEEWEKLKKSPEGKKAIASVSQQMKMNH